ncbi:g6608 [Coccomyxa elongata]
MPPFPATSCRDRTADFLAAVERHRNSQGASTSAGALENGGSGHPGTSSSTIQQQSEFAKRAAHVGQGIHNTAQNLKKLAQLAKRTGKFDDPAVEIANLSRVIKEDIQALNVALVDLQNLSAASRATNKQSSSHSHTVVDNLRLRLKDTTKEFQNVLQVRKENLEKNKARQQQFSSAPDRSTFSTARPGLQGQGASFLNANGATSEGYRAPASSQHLFGGLPPGEMGSNLGSRDHSSVSEQQPLLQQDQQLVVRQDTYLDSRAAALQNVESTIHELGGIFQQLAHMVQEQGELAIRIDENVDDTLANVDSAQAQLLKYLNTISSNRWLVMKIFMVLLVFLVIFVVFIA